MDSGSECVSVEGVGSVEYGKLSLKLPVAGRKITPVLGPLISGFQPIPWRWTVYEGHPEGK